MKKKHTRNLIWRWLALACVVLALVVFLKVDRHYAAFKADQVKPGFWGITFSKKYAQELGLDWRLSYLAMLDDLQVKKIRLPIYWDEVEAKQGTLDFTDYDWMLAEGAKRQVQFIIVLGRRLPRWPECHQPSWSATWSEPDLERKLLVNLSDQIKHFQSRSEITSWQIENEYFVNWFGVCPTGNKSFLLQEINIARQLDSRPIVLTDSGEFSRWTKVSQLADVIGTTMYRVAWNPYFGYTYSAWPAWMYRFKAWAQGFSPDKMLVAELQAEPWPPAGKRITDLTQAEINQSFSLQQFLTNSEIARRTNFSSAYLWGAEWWYWLKMHGNGDYWQLGSRLIQASK